MLLGHCKSKHRNMIMALVYNRKVFDSVPHDWIIKYFELFKVSPIIFNFLNWKTTLFLLHKSENFKSNPVYIKHHIFQAFSLSSLLFCLALIPFCLALILIPLNLIEQIMDIRAPRKVLIICFTCMIWNWLQRMITNWKCCCRR